MRKRVTIQFVGGCWDGKSLQSDSSDPVESMLARHVYLTTAKGSHGRLATLPSGHPIGEGSGYTVTDRLELPSETCVRFGCCSYPSTPAKGAIRAKRVVFEFQGGYFDGMRLDSASVNLDEALLAAAYFYLTSEGMLGKWWSVVPPSSESGGRQSDLTKRQRYEVRQRIEEPGRVTVRCRCTAEGQFSEVGQPSETANIATL